MSIFGGGKKAAAQQSTQAMGIDFQGAQYGPPIPVVYGQNKVAGNCIWYGDWQSTAHTQSQSASKGGGGGQSNTTYTYSASYQLALCEGPIASVANVYNGSSTVSVASLGGVVATGTSGQAPWAHLSGSAALGYSMTATYSVANLQLGSSASLPNYNFEIAGLKQYGSGVVDANPADILTDICTDTNHGINFNFLGSLTQFSAYCVANGLFLSPVYDSQTDATQIISDLFKYTNSYAYFSENQLKVVPLGDVAVTGNGVTYTPDVTPLVNLGPDDFIVNQGDAPVRIQRKAPQDAMNIVRVEFKDRSNTYHDSAVTASIDVDTVATGARSDTSETVDMITQATVARFVAQNLLQRVFYIRNTYEFKLSWRYCYLEPTDIVTLTDANTGLSLFPVRITEVAEDEEGLLTIQAEEFPEGIGHSAIYATQSPTRANVDPNSDPGPVNAPFLFRGPGFLTSNNTPEIWCAINGSSALWGACEVYLSHDGTSYTYMGTQAAPARYGALTGSLAAGAADPDTTNTPTVQLYAPSQLLGGSQADADNFNTLAIIDAEVFSYETATLTGTETYKLGYLRRGGYGTGNVAHAANAPFARLDEGIFRVPVDPSLIGQTVYLKFLSLNSFGRTPRTLVSETAYTYVVGTNVELPDVPPVPQGFAVAGVADGVSITWTNQVPAAVGSTSIEYATASTGPWTVLAQVGPTGTSVHHSFTNGATYFYRARARGPLVQSGWSAYTATFNSTGTNVSAIGSTASSALSTATSANNQANSVSVINPQFANGITGWNGNTGWYEEAAGSAHQPDPIVSTYCVHAGSSVISGSLATDVLQNVAHLPVVAGQSVSIACCVRDLSVNAGALAYARISWRDINNSEIATSTPIGTSQYPTCGASGTGTYTQCVTKITASAPSGAQYAVAELEVSGHTSGYFTFCNVVMGIIPSTIDEVPDGSVHAKVLALQLQNGIVAMLNGGRNCIFNPTFTQNLTGPTNGNSTTSGPVIDGWTLYGGSALNVGIPYNSSIRVRIYGGFALVASGLTYGATIESNLFAVTAGAPFAFMTNRNNGLSAALPAGVTATHRVYIDFRDNANNHIAFSTLYDINLASANGTNYYSGTVPAGASQALVVMYPYFTNSGAATTLSSGSYYDCILNAVEYVQATNLDNDTVDGTTYQRMPAANMDANRRGLVDFSQGGHLYKNVDNIADGSTYGRFKLSSMTGNDFDFSKGGVNKTMDYMGDGGTYYRMPGANMDGNRRGLIDFSQGAHLNKNVDNIADGTTYARIKSAQLQSGVVNSIGSGRNAVFNPSFTQNATGIVNGSAVQSGVAIDGWSCGGGNADSYVIPYNSTLRARSVAGFALNASTVNSGITYSASFACNKFAVNGGQPYKFNVNRSSATAGVALPGGVTAFHRVYVTFFDGTGTFIENDNVQDVAWNAASGMYYYAGTVPSNAATGIISCYMYFSNTGAATTLPSGSYYDAILSYVEFMQATQLDNDVIDGTTYARIYGSELSSGKHRLGVANSGAVLGNQLNAPNSLTLNYGSARTATACTATSAGAVSINAFSVNMGGTTVSYNAVSNAVTGLTVGDTYQIYCHDPGGTGGTKTWYAYLGAATGLLTLGDDVVLGGQVTIPSSGSSGGGGGGYCPLRTAWCIRRGKDGRPHYVRVGKVRVGDFLLLIDGTWGEVTHSTPALTPCVRLVARGGTLGCSDIAPIKTINSHVIAREAKGMDVLVRGSSEHYSTVSDVIDLGEQWVQHITCQNAFFWTGDSKRFLFGHHNLKP